MTELLADALTQLGHAVTVATLTSSASKDCGESLPYTVIRRPSAVTLFKCCAASDGMIVMGNTLRLAWPLFLMAKRALLVHHMFPDPKRKGLMRKILMRRSVQVAPSRALARSLEAHSFVVPNPYDEKCFYPGSKPEKASANERIVFAGRMISEKGGSVLLDAVTQLHQAGIHFHLTLVGDGPERHSWEDLVKKVDGLASKVSFLGIMSRYALADVLRSSDIAVVPSLCDEAFGLSAIEALACGCKIVVSSAGGLPEAVGRCGYVVDKADAKTLADVLKRLLVEPSGGPAYQSEVAKHLLCHKPSTVAKQYVKLLAGT